MRKRKIIIVGNWKMNPKTAELARLIFRQTLLATRKLKAVEVVVCPPAIFLGLFKQSSNTKISLGLQDISWQEAGAHTGEVSAAMAVSMGAGSVIIGHSERRALGETDEVVAKKARAAARAGLRAVVCVGEPRRDLSGAHFNFIKNQLNGSLSETQPRDLKRVVIAYEPVWAIGKSAEEAMKPGDVHETALFIKKVLSDMFGADSAKTVPILYGGSVNFENAGSIIKDGEVDGLLVGRQSVDISNLKKFLSTINAF